MRWMIVFVLGLAACRCVASVGMAEEPVSEHAVRAAIERSIPLLELAMKESADQRKCFTCHNQALPMIALATAQQRGFAIDAKNFARQRKHTADHLTRGKKRYLEGQGQGGRVVTAGYALWALDAAKYERDEITNAVAAYLLQTQKKNHFWHQASKRPPSSGSDFMATFISLRALNKFSSEAQATAVQERSQQVQRWLTTAQPRDVEDRVFQLRLLHSLDTPMQLRDKALAELLQAQHEDGGWSQKKDMASDAYATGTALAALLEVRPNQQQTQSVARATRYLVEQQLEDGSWHVATRAEGFQEYFEAGYPHDEDQFISVAAGAWATQALLLTLPVVAQEANQ